MRSLQNIPTQPFSIRTTRSYHVQRMENTPFLSISCAPIHTTDDRIFTSLFFSRSINLFRNIAPLTDCLFYRFQLVTAVRTFFQPHEAFRRKLHHIESKQKMCCRPFSPAYLHIMDNTDPVSYTHLDVYKRQPLHRTCIS